jgi:hypothetical protein
MELVPHWLLMLVISEVPASLPFLLKDSVFTTPNPGAYHSLPFILTRIGMPASTANHFHLETDTNAIPASRIDFLHYRRLRYVIDRSDIAHFIFRFQTEFTLVGY